MGSTPFCAQYYDLFGPELFVVVAWGAGKKDTLDGVDSRGRDFTRSARRLLKRDSKGTALPLNIEQHHHDRFNYYPKIPCDYKI